MLLTPGRSGATSESIQAKLAQSYHSHPTWTYQTMCVASTVCDTNTMDVGNLGDVREANGKNQSAMLSAFLVPL